MVAPTMDLLGWLRKHLEEADTELLRELVATFMQALMSAEADAACGAALGERSAERVNQRNGYTLGGARSAPTQAEWAGGRLGGDLDPAEGIGGAAVSNPSDPADPARHRRVSQPVPGIADTSPLLAGPVFQP